MRRSRVRSPSAPPSTRLTASSRFQHRRRLTPQLLGIQGVAAYSRLRAAIRFHPQRSFVGYFRGYHHAQLEPVPPIMRLGEVAIRAAKPAHKRCKLADEKGMYLPIVGAWQLSRKASRLNGQLVVVLFVAVLSLAAEAFARAGPAGETGTAVIGVFLGVFTLFARMPAMKAYSSPISMARRRVSAAAERGRHILREIRDGRIIHDGFMRAVNHMTSEVTVRSAHGDSGSGLTTRVSAWAAATFEGREFSFFPGPCRVPGNGRPRSLTALLVTRRRLG
jgi:hypothetical protein